MDGVPLYALHDWSRQAPRRQMGDWLFASLDLDGTLRYWPEKPLKCFVQPAANCAGATNVLGWHRFRRTFATLLKGGGEDVKTVQELMRHANSNLTMEVHAQALLPLIRQHILGWWIDSASGRNNNWSFVVPRRGYSRCE